MCQAQIVLEVIRIISILICTIVKKYNVLNNESSNKLYYSVQDKTKLIKY